HTRSKRDWSSDVCSSDLHADALHLLRQILAIRIAAAQRLPVGGVRSEQREILSAGISIHGDIPAELPLGFAEGHTHPGQTVRGRSEERRGGEGGRGRREQ